MSFISSFILFKVHILHVGFDMQFHFRRIMELKESIINAKIFPNFSFNQFHGSGVMSTYPYLDLFPAVLLSFIIKSKITFVYAFFMLNILSIFIVSFYSCVSYVKSSYITAYVFSVLYSLSNVLLYHNFISSDVGIVFSYIFLPLVIFGFMKVIQDDKNGWIELSLGMSMILYGHILNVLLISFFLFLIFIINIKKINKAIFINLIKSILLFILITCVIWLPFIHFYFNNFNNINMPPSIQLSNVNIQGFIKGLYGSKDSSTIGFFPIISIIISIFFYKNFNRYIKQMYWVSLVIVICVLFLPWKSITSYAPLNILNQIQFTFRFFIVPQMMLTFILSLIITKYISSINKILISFLTIFIAITMQMMGQYKFVNDLSNKPSIKYYLQKDNNHFKNAGSGSNLYSIKNSSYFNLFIKSYSPSYDDYIPKNSLPMLPYINNNLGVYNNSHKITVNHIGYNTFNFSNKININKLSLPIYVYNKERLHVYLNGKQVNNYANENSLLTIDNIKDNIKLNNEVYIKPVLDPFRIISAILSIFGWLFALLIIVKKKFER